MPDGDERINNRFLIKLSGEAFGSTDSGLDSNALDSVGKELILAREECSRIAVVVGGGNFYRSRNARAGSIGRVKADYVGMLATVMNGVVLQQWLEAQSVSSVVFSAFPIRSICECYTPDKAIALLESGSMVILAGGTGSPFFTTDTAASLRALEIGASLLIKATRVDGVYDRNPENDHTAVKYDVVDFETVLAKRLAVMDSTAFAMCQDNRLAIRVLDINVPGNLRRAVRGEDVGTLVTSRRLESG